MTHAESRAGAFGARCRPGRAGAPGPVEGGTRPGGGAACSWLNLVECFFSVITRQAIRRGTFTSVKELIAAIGAFIDSWNDHPRPFAWAKDADDVLAKIERAKAKANSLTDQ
jgi:hypothetical protein